MNTSRVYGLGWVGGGTIQKIDDIKIAVDRGDG